MAKLLVSYTVSRKQFNSMLYHVKMYLTELKMIYYSYPLFRKNKNALRRFFKLQLLRKLRQNSKNKNSVVFVL
jgi:hypothetical protein